MTYIIDFPRGILGTDGDQYDLTFDPSKGGTRFSNAFGKTNDVTGFNVENDESGPGKLVSGDYVAPIVNGQPIEATYIGSAKIDFEPVGNTVDQGSMTGFKVNIDILPFKASVIQTASGELKLMTPEDFNKDDLPILVTFSFNGEPVTVETTLANLGSDMVNAATEAGMENLDDIINHIWLKEDSYKADAGTARPVAPLTVNSDDDLDLDPNDITLVPCFTRGTLIATVKGLVAIENLTEGDLVLTKDHGPQPVRWIGSTALSAGKLQRAEHLRPIRISAGSLGAGLPEADLTVSPQHRVLLRSRIAEKLFGAPEVLVAAKQLLQVEGIDIVDDLTAVEYFHILFDQHEVLFSNGAETESLFTGPVAPASISEEAKAEIFELFPELMDRSYKPSAARVLLSGRQARKLVVRHIQNGKPLVAAA